MKLTLAGMDVHGTGRVTLADFYRGNAWQFSESSKDLKQMGALDVSSAWLGPQVIISNTSRDSLIASASRTTSVWYINECDGIYQHLEARIRHLPRLQLT